MTGQMRFHLTLRLHHEAQAHTRPEAPRQQAQSESTCIPERVQQRRASTQFVQALSGPGQVIGFFFACGLKLDRQCRMGCAVAGKGGARRKRLCGVQRLSAHLADMIHPHQGAGQDPVRLAQLAVANLRDCGAGA